MASETAALKQLYYDKLQSDNRLLKMACVLTAVTVVFICVIWDWVWLENQPKILLEILGVRLFSAFIPLGMLLALLFTGYFRDWFNRLSQFAILSISIGIACTNLIGLKHGYGSIMQPIMLVTLFGYFFTSLTWREKILVTFPLIGLTAWFDIEAQLGKDQLVYDMVYLVLVNIMGAVSSISSQKMGLHNMEIQLKLEQMAETDPLTGLDNRYSFERRFETLTASGNSQGVAIAIADLDHFKSFNDCYGHMEGDQCLTQVARLMQEKIADKGLVARLGGEEFVVLIYGIDFEDARLRALNLINAVRGLQIDHWGSTTSDVVTMSMGLVWADAVIGRDRRALMEMADRALYIAKQKRDSCVCMTTEQAAEILPDKLLNQRVASHNNAESFM